MIAHKIKGVASHRRHGLGGLLAAGRVSAHARPAIHFGQSCPALCGCMGSSKYKCALCSKSRRGHLRISDLVVCRHRGDSSEVAVAVELQQEQTASEADVELRAEDGQGLLTQVPVVFELGKHCTFGHSFAIVGETPELGEWDTTKAARMEWSDGDLWRVGVSLPGDTLVSFKYIELGKNDQLVAWCSEVPDGTNMTVTVSRSDELISGYKVEVLQGGPHLSVRLDVTAFLPMSTAYFKEKQLAVSAGLPAAVADDLLTDRVLVEQGLMDEAELEAKWSMEAMSAIRDQYADAAVAESWDANPAAIPQDDLIAATESVVIIAAPEADGQEPTDTAAALAATAAELAATAVDELPVDNDIIAATESDVIRRAIDTSDDQLAAVPLAAAVAAVNNAESGDVIINVYGDIPADDEDSDAEDDITSAKDEAGPSDAVVSESLAVASATAAATDTAKHDSTVTVVSLLSSAEPSSPASSSSSLTSPPPSSDTKFVSAGASAVSVDLHSPIRDINKAVVELDAQGVEPVEPVHVNEGLAIPATDTAASSSGSSTESGAQAVEQQEQATVSKVVVTTDGGNVSVTLRSDDQLSLPGPPEVAAVRGAAAAAGFDTEAKTVGDQGLLVSRELQGEQQLGHEPSSSSSGGNLDALAAAVAAAASLQYAGQSAAADEVIDLRPGSSDFPAAAAALTAASVSYTGGATAGGTESPADSNTTAKAVDERSAVPHGTSVDAFGRQLTSGDGVVSGRGDNKQPRGFWQWLLGKNNH